MINALAGTREQPRPHTMPPCRALLFAILMPLFAGFAQAAVAKPPPAGPQDLKHHKADLDDLKQRIERLKKELGASESARNEAADQLRESEKAISDLQRELLELAQAREARQQRQHEIAAQTRQAETQLLQQQSHLDRLLVQQYMTGAPGPLQLLLSGQNPNQTARDMTYLGIIAQARQGVVHATANLIDEKNDWRKKPASRPKPSPTLKPGNASSRKPCSCSANSIRKCWPHWLAS